MNRHADIRPLQDEVTRLYNAGQPTEALEVIHKARRERPEDPGPTTLFGMICQSVGQDGEALPVFDEALRIDSSYAPAHYHRGLSNRNLGRLADAALDFKYAAKFQPGYAAPMAQLADLAALRGDTVEARVWAKAVLDADPDEPVASLASVAADLADRDFDAAELRARNLTASPRLTPVNRAIAQSYRADALDGMDKPAEAFAAYAAANDALRAVYAKPLERPEEHTPLGHARRLLDYFSAADPADWQVKGGEGASGPAERHVFLVGFPRSGTTLLEQVMASHPKVVALEEKNTLEHALKDLFLDAPALERLARATQAELQPYRDAYWKRVAELGADVAGKVFIDKMPLNTVLLPLIGKLFPDARILFALRDPRDVVLSCFRRRFGMNPAMYQMLTLKGAAEYYDVVMRLGELYGPLLGQTLRQVRYDRLVADFAVEARATAAFLGLTWTDAMDDFAATAKARDVDTPSSAQVTRPLYAEGVGQWRRYQAQMAPVAPILDPWVARFGYPAA